LSRGHGLIGRDEELSAIGELLGKPVPIVLRGPRGAGKTALLEEVAAGCRDRSIRAITVELTSDGSWDLFGVLGTLRALRAGFAEIGSSRLAAALDAVNQLCTPTTYASPASRGRLLHSLQRLFDSFHGSMPSVVLFDDVDADPATVITTALIALRAGCTVVVACDDESVALELTSVREAAGRIVELGPLADEHIGDVVAIATRQQPDPDVTQAIRAALGSLAGNPGAVLAVCESLLNQGRLTELGGAVCLAEPDAPIALPAEHWLVRFAEETHEFGPRLLALIADSEWFTMDDLAVFAAAVHGELGACGRAVDEFTAIGALRCTSNGELSIACPALGAAAIDAIGADQLRALHLAFAQHLGAGNQGLGHVLFPLADHLAAAGDLAVGEPDAATVLDRAARRIRPVNSTVAARWHRAALAHGDLTDRAELVRELVRIGRYDWLGDVADDDSAACLAALHTGIPLPAAMTVPLVRRWFTENRTFDAAELAQALDGSGHHATDGWFDPIGMLGSAYGTPESGPLVLSRRIVDGYRRGQWDDALSAARTLIATYPATTPVHELARLLAAEMSGRRGEPELAEQWLGEPDRHSAFPTLRSWVEMGLPVDDTLETGWQAYATAVDAPETVDTNGLHQLVIRYALLATTLGDGAGLAELQESAKTWCKRLDAPEASGTELLVTAIAQNSYPAARSAAAALREQGYQAELATACLIAARMADDPRPWLNGADEIAELLGDTWLRTHIKALTRARGVTLPRRTSGSRSSAKVEGRIIELIQQGMTNRQIAAEIQVSEKSVERHLTKLFAKAGCRSRLGLVAAYERGVLSEL
jgi:DNA-binding CsgD family transcriptional regulator